jgi:hypothetical protein
MKLLNQDPEVFATREQAQAFVDALNSGLLDGDEQATVVAQAGGGFVITFFDDTGAPVFTWTAS